MPVTEHSRLVGAQAAGDPTAHLLDDLAGRIIDQPEPRDLALFVYSRLRTLMPAESFYVAMASQQAEGLHAVLVMDEDVEYPSSSIYIEPYDESLTQEQVYFDRDATRNRWTFGTGRPSASCLTCTMRARGRVVGQISTMSYYDDAFDAVAGTVLRAVARLLTVAFDRILERQEAARREEELVGFWETNHRVNASLEVAEFLRGLATSLAKTLSDGSVVISRLNTEESLLVPCAFADAHSADPERLPPPFAIAAHPEIEAVLRDRMLIVGPDPIRWPVDQGWCNRLALPIIVEDTLLGLVELVSRNPQTQFNAHEVEIFRTMIDQAALWIQQAQADQHAAEQGAAPSGSAAFSEAIGKVVDDLPTMFNLICLEAMARVRMNRVSLFMLDAGEEQLELKAMAGTEHPLPEGARIRVKEPHAQVARAVRERRIVVETDLTRGGNLGSGRLPLLDIGVAGSAVALPLRHNGTNLGALLLADRRRRAVFRDEDLRLLAALAGQAGAAIARARMRAGEAERARIASVLSTISAGLGADSAPDEIYSLILGQAARLVPFAEASITLFEDGRQRLCAATGPALEELAELTAKDGIWRDHRNVDVAACREVSVLHDVLERRGMGDLLSLPLLVNGTVMGRLTFVSRRAEEYDTHLAQLSALLAERTANVARMVQLRAAQQSALAKMTELDALRQDFVATVSHELRTPLTGILGYLELLLNRWNSLDEDRRINMLQRVQSAATRLEHLVNDLLLFSNVEHQDIHLQVGRFPLRSLIEQAAEEIGTKYRNQVFNVQIPPANLFVMVDAQRTIQVIANILDNAVKYSKVGSPVFLRSTAGRMSIRISVRDQGPGISPEDMPRLFQRFGTLGHAPRPGQVGTGIGLYICKKLVEAMNGEISVNSRPGTGSTFHIRLPRA
jgi:signal transduction histidine kinase